MPSTSLDQRKKRYEEIKRVLTENDGSVTVASSILGMPMTHLSRVLNSTLRSWWVPFKERRKKERSRSRQARYKQRLAQAAQDRLNEARNAQGLPPIYPHVNPEDYI